MSKEMDNSHHGGEDAKDFHVGQSHETLHRVYTTWTGTFGGDFRHITADPIWLHLYSQCLPGSDDGKLDL